MAGGSLGSLDSEFPSQFCATAKTTFLGLDANFSPISPQSFPGVDEKIALWGVKLGATWAQNLR
jgi:hypothetical protein